MNTYFNLTTNPLQFTYPVTPTVEGVVVVILGHIEALPPHTWPWRWVTQVAMTLWPLHQGQGRQSHQHERHTQPHVRGSARYRRLLTWRGKSTEKWPLVWNLWMESHLLCYFTLLIYQRWYPCPDVIQSWRKCWILASGSGEIYGKWGNHLW